MKYSRHLGALSFCEDGDESVVDAAVTIAGCAAAAMLVVKDPRAFDQDAVERLDDELDRLTAREADARAAIARDVRDPGTAAGRFWAFFRDDVPGWAGDDPDEFVAALTVVRIGVFPDGAWGSTSVLVIDYGIEEPQTDRLLIARFPDAHTPEISGES